MFLRMLLLMWRVPAVAHNDCARPEAGDAAGGNAIAAAAGAAAAASFAMSFIVYAVGELFKCCRSLKNELKLSSLQGVLLVIRVFLIVGIFFFFFSNLLLVTVNI